MFPDSPLFLETKPRKTGRGQDNLPIPEHLAASKQLITVTYHSSFRENKGISDARGGGTKTNKDNHKF